MYNYASRHNWVMIVSYLLRISNNMPFASITILSTVGAIFWAAPYWLLVTHRGELTRTQVDYDPICLFVCLSFYPSVCLSIHVCEKVSVWYCRDRFLRYCRDRLEPYCDLHNDYNCMVTHRREKVNSDPSQLGPKSTRTQFISLYPTPLIYICVCVLCLQMPCAYIDVCLYE